MSRKLGFLLGQTVNAANSHMNQAYLCQRAFADDCPGESVCNIMAFCMGMNTAKGGFNS